MAGKYRTVHVTTLNIGTIQDIEIPGFEDVAGATFKWVLSNLAGTNKDGMGAGMGAASFAGSGFQWACSSFSEDAADPSQCSSMGSVVAAIQISNATGTGTDLVGTVTKISTGIRITWDGVPTTAWHLEIKLFSGDTMQCEAGVLVDDNTVVNFANTTVLTEMTIEPEVLLFASPGGHDFSETPSADAFFAMGFGNSALEQGGWGYADEDGRTGANRHGHRLSATRVIEIPNWAASGVPLVSLELTNTSVVAGPLGAFQTTKRDTSMTFSWGWFAFSTDGVQSSKIEAVLVDTNTTGGKSYTGAGFPVGSCTVFSTNLPALGGNNGNNAGGGPCSSDIDDKTMSEGCYSAGSAESDPSNTYSLFGNTFVLQRTNLGNDSFEADFTAFTWDGFDFNVSDASPVDKYWIILCLEEEPWGRLYWENLCLENDHARTAGEITNGKDWAQETDRSAEAQEQPAFFGSSLIPVEGTVSDQEIELGRLVHDFELNIAAENWNGAWHALWQIREWTP